MSPPICSGNVLPILPSPRQLTPEVSVSRRSPPHLHTHRGQIVGRTPCNVSAGPLRNGNPRGDPNAAPRCGARTRAGCPCRAPAMANGRCRMHGGRSTGPRTPEGLARLAAARTKHGAYNAASRAFHAGCRTLVVRSNLLIMLSRDPAFGRRPRRPAPVPPAGVPPAAAAQAPQTGGKTPCNVSSPRLRPRPASPAPTASPPAAAASASTPAPRAPRSASGADRPRPTIGSPSNATTTSPRCTPAAATGPPSATSSTSTPLACGR